MFSYLRAQRRGAGTGRATAYYSLSPADPVHRYRLAWMAGGASAGPPLVGPATVPVVRPSQEPGPRTLDRPHGFVAFNHVKTCRYGTMVFNAFDRYVGRSLDLYGEFSEGEVEMFRQLVRPGDTVLDIGANIGAHTLFFARHVGPSGSVVAVEPQRVVFQTLCANLALNSVTNVWCLPCAAGAEPGETTVPHRNYAQSGNFGGVEVGGAAEGEAAFLC